MTRVQLLPAKERRKDEHQLILADKDKPDALAGALHSDEWAFFQPAAARGVMQFFFPRKEGSVAIRLLKSEKDPAIAAESARLQGNEALRDIRQYKLEVVHLLNFSEPNSALAFLEGMVLGSYKFSKYFSKKDKEETALRQIYVGPSVASAAEVSELDALLEAVFLARDLVNEPQSHLDTLVFADAIADAGARYGFSVDTLDKSALEDIKMGGLLAVNRASPIPPRFCILEWKPPQYKNPKPVVLIGKGVVYDTGGLSLKPSEGMDYMKCDMAGAASVVGALSAVAQNRLPLHVVGLVPITDNKIGANALAPGDVITMYDGKTVEVVNTDAEGRLILADAMHYAQRYKPSLVLDLATLTGAAVKALGSQAICYMGTAPEKVKKNLEHSGFATYERLIELPLWKEYGEELKSSIADLKNLGSNNAGMITAGKFLEHFAHYPWLHLDIAGPAYLRAANGYRPKEGSGVGVRLLYHFLKKMC